jgi:hypothetical protein
MRTEITAAVFALVMAAAQTGVIGYGLQDSAASVVEREKLTFHGDVALWTLAIKPDKTADFERVMDRLREALMNSDEPQRREQAKGWRVVRIAKPLPDGNIAYVHVIDPVVEGADYTVMQVLYDELPDERRELYELYRGAFAQNLALGLGDIAVDMAVSAPPTPQTAAVAR